MTSEGYATPLGSKRKDPVTTVLPGSYPLWRATLGCAFPGFRVTAPDHYTVLGVPPTAGDDEVRAAYRARSMLLHPDVHQERPDAVRLEADRAMAQLTEAYRAIVAEREADRERRDGPARATPASPLRRLGRAAARSRTARLAAEAGEQDGGVAYRLGWLVGRRRSG
jgi:hypothetical protein